MPTLSVFKGRHSKGESSNGLCLRRTSRPYVCTALRTTSPQCSRPTASHRNGGSQQGSPALTGAVELPAQDSRDGADPYSHTNQMTAKRSLRFTTTSHISRDCGRNRKCNAQPPRTATWLTEIRDEHSLPRTTDVPGSCPQP